ncbi:MAG: murein biosynthesis integral membrane protein MurJ [Acidimicrobiales bacterium]
MPVNESSATTRASLGMALGTLASRLSGFAKLAVLAYALGYGPLSDSYNLANNTPNIIYDLILGGILAATLIPVFVDRLATRDPVQAGEDISAVIGVAGAVLIVATVVFALAAGPIVGLYTLGNHSAAAPAERHAATTLLRLFAPQLAFYGFISLITAVLNAHRRFVVPMFAPVINNLVVIGVLVEFIHLTHHRPGLTSLNTSTHLSLLLGLGTTAGVVLQGLILVPSLIRAGAGISWRWDPSNEAVRTIVRLSGWTLGFVVTNQVALFIVLALADRHAGGVTAYNYAYTFFQLPFGIIAVSIMSAIQPGLARAWALGDRPGFRIELARGLRRTNALIIPAATGYLVLAGSIVTLILHFGTNRSSGVHTTAVTLAFFALGLPGFCAYLLFVRAYQAMQNTRAAFWLYLLENGLNVVLAFVLFGVMGTPGLALALSLSYTAGALVAGASLSWRRVGIAGTGTMTVLGRVLFASACMGGAVAAVAAVGGALGMNHGAALVAKLAISAFVGVSVLVVVAGYAADRRSQAGVTSAWSRY